MASLNVTRSHLLSSQWSLCSGLILGFTGAFDIASFLALFLMSDVLLTKAMAVGLTSHCPRQPDLQLRRFLLLYLTCCICACLGIIISLIICYVCLLSLI